MGLSRCFCSGMTHPDCPVDHETEAEDREIARLAREADEREADHEQFMHDCAIRDEHEAAA